MMRLQINTRGAWKDLVQFELARRDDVLRAAKLFGGILGGYIKWSIVNEDGQREWLAQGLGPWEPITDISPAPLVDVLVTTHDSFHNENVVFMAYRKHAGSADFYLSGTDGDVLRNAYAWTPVLDPAPAQQVVA